MRISNTEANQEFYQLLIEKADDLEKYRSPEALKELAEEVYDGLISLG